MALRSRKAFLQLLAPGLIGTLALTACGGPPPARLPGTPANFAQGPAGTGVSVVAAENFYGDIAQQLGAGHVSVVSILSDPTIDPHEYESSVQDAVAVSRAQLVIENGSDYDTWMDKLIAASPSSNRVLLVAADFANTKLADNPHYWYSLDDIAAIAQAISSSLEGIDPGHTPDYSQALTNFRLSLVPIRDKMNQIRLKYNGTPVALTETIFLYQSEEIGLNVLTPFPFQKAIAEGNDPPADTVVTTEDQITTRRVKTLIYNVQTITPVTTNLTQQAAQFHIPLVPVSETMPPGNHYQSWMLDQLAALQQALGG